MSKEKSSHKVNRRNRENLNNGSIIQSTDNRKKMKRSLFVTAFLLIALGMLNLTGEVSAKNSGINKSDNSKMTKNNDLWWIYIGNTTGQPTDAMIDNNVPQSKGIYVGRFNSQTGAITNVRLALEVTTSNFFAQDSDKGILYASGQMKKTDPHSVMAF